MEKTSAAKNFNNLTILQLANFYNFKEIHRKLITFDLSILDVDLNRDFKHSEHVKKCSQFRMTELVKMYNRAKIDVLNSLGDIIK